ncbi:30S ribosomal protein S13 [Candidatus Hodgkinia cicadicola]|nr:30S ribosomal protein S13 [Candidatus Hodgkinia cicadicola]
MLLSLRRGCRLGKPVAQTIIASSGVSRGRYRVKLSMSHRFRIRQIMEQQLKLGDASRQQISENITMFKNVVCYGGLIRRRRLPVRGQRTRSSARLQHFVADGVF